MLTNTIKHELLILLFLSITLLLNACAPAEAELASNALPTAINATEVTVEALQPLPSPTAMLVATPTAVATRTPTTEATNTPDPTNTVTVAVATDVVETATVIVERVSAESVPTIEPIEATQIVIMPTATPQPPQKSPTSINVPTSLQPITDKMVDDIFGRTNVDRSTITLTSYEAVTWPDGAIGCPEPGYAYTQALVDGYRFIFDANGQQMLYHTAGTTNFVYCNTNKIKPDKPVEGSPGDT